MPTPRQWFRDAHADFRATRTGAQKRAQVRADVAELVNAAMDWLNRHDQQENGAQAAFAADRPAAYRTFVDALPPVDPDQTP